jgi:hypothetical protein
MLQSILGSINSLKNKEMKNLFAGIFLSIICICCTRNEREESNEGDLKVKKSEKTIDSASFQTPYESKVWNIMSGKITDYSEIIKYYRLEKNTYQNDLHFENTMDSWHKTLVKFSKDMSLLDAEEILKDMDDLPNNIISYSTYYKLINNFSEVKNIGYVSQCCGNCLYLRY